MYGSPIHALASEHMRLVGIIAAHWEFLDVVLQRTLAEIMGHDHHQLALLTENVPFRAKRELLMAYARSLEDSEPDLWKEFTQIDRDLLAAYGLRNKYVHARWKEGEIHELPIRVVTRINGGRFTFADERTCICHLEDAARAIWETGARLTKFFQKFDLLLKP
jgi:hypothetical protein